MLAAMAPCTRLYGYIGCQLARAHKGGVGGGGRRRPPHPYSHWIRTYSAPAYLRLPAAKERIIDQLGADVPYGVLPLCSALRTPWHPMPMGTTALQRLLRLLVGASFVFFMQCIHLKAVTFTSQMQVAAQPILHGDALQGGVLQQALHNAIKHSLDPDKTL